MIRDGESLNGVQFNIDVEDSVVVLKVFVDGRYTSWIEFGEGQMEHLISEAENALSTLKDILEAKGDKK